ncbi:3-isopropylmalate/(R)-2-methylmalate dehydratase large subunit [Pigmentiphaga kullae]|uniref:3-isopropylmalate/(R)-2-methylmalate dehydratase large subunit n=2 Tax=Pigmentiphaga kullae TaxID=151784 RepID=A0A4Q7N7Q8_9BURK|nr:3-isopropylmalate/(R)-2-methylmalate dehydratase large subunit [Pigmentiphaga kullae]
MGMTAFEKIVARAAGVPAVKPGDVVYPIPDLMFMHDGQVGSTKEELDDIGIDKLWDPSRVVIVTDHDVVYTTPKAAQKGMKIREAVKAWKIDKFYDIGAGGHGHIFPMEQGLVRPGMFIFANDMHCTNFGAIGAVALRMGTEIATVIARGTTWFTVPPTVRIVFTGQLKAGVYGRDVGYRISRDMVDGRLFGGKYSYRVIELAGAVHDMDFSNRVALCNSPTEIGVATLFIPPSGRLSGSIPLDGDLDLAALCSDEDARYEADEVFDLSELEPQVALPGSPDRAVDVSEVTGVHVHHAFIGSCGSGTYEDLVIAESLIRGKRIASGTRLYVAPGSVETARRAADEGLISSIQRTGAIILQPGCGVCSGGKVGPLGPGEVSISTAATNAPGRMGPRDAQVYLASPATVAASSLRGEIADARRLAAA